MLTFHNEKRALHVSTNAVANDDTVAAVAKAYAANLALNNSGLVHSSGSGYGENLGFIGDTSLSTSVNADCETLATRVGGLWYDEISSYNFDTGSAAPGSVTGHFTQFVWDSTTSVGFGLGAASANGPFYIVGNYNPPGNYIGSYTQHVQRLI
jgi:hypothetical protein